MGMIAPPYSADQSGKNGRRWGSGKGIREFVRGKGYIESMQQKKRHHFIPITYLEKFTDETGRIFAYRKDEVKPHLYIAPRNIAFIKYYYSQPLPAGGRDNNTLENYFSTIECEWNGLVNRFSARQGSESNFTEDDFISFFTFLGLMRVRVPATRDVVELIRAEEVKATACLLDRQGKLPPKPEGCEDILDHLSVAINAYGAARPAISRAWGLSSNGAETPIQAWRETAFARSKTSLKPRSLFTDR
jgi:hypothetical protein